MYVHEFSLLLTKALSSNEYVAPPPATSIHLIVWSLFPKHSLTINQDDDDHGQNEETHLPVIGIDLGEDSGDAEQQDHEDQGNQESHPLGQPVNQEGTGVYAEQVSSFTNDMLTLNV